MRILLLTVFAVVTLFISCSEDSTAPGLSAEELQVEMADVTTEALSAYKIAVQSALVPILQYPNLHGRSFTNDAIEVRSTGCPVFEQYNESTGEYDVVEPATDITELPVSCYLNFLERCDLNLGGNSDKEYAKGRALVTLNGELCTQLGAMVSICPLEGFDVFNGTDICTLAHPDPSKEGEACMNLTYEGDNAEGMMCFRGDMSYVVITNRRLKRTFRFEHIEDHVVKLKDEGLPHDPNNIMSFVDDLLISEFDYLECLVTNTDENGNETSSYEMRVNLKEPLKYDLFDSCPDGGVLNIQSRGNFTEGFDVNYGHSGNQVKTINGSRALPRCR